MYLHVPVCTSSIRKTEHGRKEWFCSILFIELPLTECSRLPTEDSGEELLENNFYIHTLMLIDHEFRHISVILKSYTTILVYIISEHKCIHIYL